MEEEKFIYHLIVVLIISLFLLIGALFSFLLTSVTSLNDENLEKPHIVYMTDISPKEQELESFLLSLDRLNKNCGETFITKKYGSNEWYVFTALNENPYQLVRECY